MSGTVRLILAAASGLLQFAAHPPLGLWPLAFVAIVPLLYATRSDDSAARSVVAGMICGLAFWLPLLFWVTHTFRVYGGLSWPVALAIWVGFASIMSILDFVPLLWAYTRTQRLGTGWALALFPFLWAAQEWWRTWHFTGFPWGLTAQAVVPAPALLGPSRLLGVAFLSFLVVAFQCGLVGIRRAGTRGRGLASVAAVMAVFALSRPTDRHAGPEIRVLIVQQAVPQDLRWNPELMLRQQKELLEMTRSAALGTAPDLVVWPESALPLNLESSEAVRDAVASLARDLESSILVNTVRQVSAGEYYNSARLVLPDGSLSEAYDKRRLVPFGEYVPAKWAFGWAGKLTQSVGDFSVGRRPELLPAPRRSDGRVVPVGVAICYEVVYPAIFRDEVRLGARLLATITNDGWYGGMGAEAQHWNGAVLSAVANGRSLVRAAATGISGAVLPSGRVVDRLELGQRGTLAVRLPERGVMTLASRVGDGFCWISALVALCAILASLRAGRRPRRPVSVDSC